MSKPIYKYVGPAYVGKVLASPDHVTFKCSRPKDFNDPYELFLTINFNESPELLAFYSEVVGELPQIPTTCFSRSPIVIPMWAHYAQNLEGVAIALDEQAMTKRFPESGFGDVDYRDAAEDEMTDLLARAFEIQKPRYLYLLQRDVFNAAYYTKLSCWSYEQERRMLVRESETRSDSGVILIDVPADCVTGLICGPRASTETVDLTRARAQQLGCPFYMLRIGRTTPVPYLTDADGRSHTFEGLALTQCTSQCATCDEPLGADAEQCSWCQIDTSHEHEAASRNIFRAFAHLGLLDDYIRGMQDISARHNTKKN